MRVLFKNDWFGPSQPVHKNALQTVCGQRFRKGVREVPEWMRDQLPKSARVMGQSEPDPADVPAQPETLADHDVGLKSVTLADEVVQNADMAAAVAEKRRLARLANLAKGRAAKANKE